MSEKSKEVEKMISKVEKKKDLTRNQAIDYMLGVATGRLAALWRYDESVPEGKHTKGILQLAGKKKRAPKTTKISVLPDSHAPEERPAKVAKPAKVSKRAKKATKPAKKRRTAKSSEETEQLEISTE
jgi:hypothetical protein